MDWLICALLWEHQIMYLRHLLYTSINIKFLLQCVRAPPGVTTSFIVRVDFAFWDISHSGTLFWYNCFWRGEYVFFLNFHQMRGFFDSLYIMLFLFFSEKKIMKWNRSKFNVNFAKYWNTLIVKWRIALLLIKELQIKYR